MNPALSLLKEIDDVVDLGDPVPHNETTVTHSGPVTVVSDRRQWSYAVAFRLRSEALQQCPPTGRLLLRIHLVVRIGRIGAVYVADDLETVLSGPAQRSESGGGAALDLLLPSPLSSGWLVLRNDSPLGHAAECEIHSIKAFAVEPKIDPGNRALAEVLSPDFRHIDLSKLGAAAARGKEEMAGNSYILAALRQKWSEIPAGPHNRRRTSELLTMPDEELLDLWMNIHREATSGAGFSVRGWYQVLYRDFLRGKRVLDVGSGLRIDGLEFARHGALITFLDIVESNLEILRRLTRIMGITGAEFHYLADLDSLQALPPEFDIIWCQGSMIDAPFSFTRREAHALLEHLPVGGRWIELAYPRERWERDGRLPFREWGHVTDGEGTPWMEWYDLERIRARFQPAEFDVILYHNFHHDDFNWFDLIRRK